MDERYSHPGSENSESVRLVDHLRDVADRSRRLLDPARSVGDGVPLRELAATVAWCHDAGKLTTWFQQHIGEMPGEPEGPTDHAFFGATLAHYALERRYDGELPLVGFVAVARHHGKLPDAADYVYDRAFEREIYEKMRDDVRLQTKDVDSNAPELAGEIVTEATNGDGSWTEFKNGILNGSRFGAIGSHVGDEIMPDPDPLTDSFYEQVLQLWSTLVLADKTSAADAPDPSTVGTPIEREPLTNHIEDLGEPDDPSRAGRLDQLRDRAREEVLTSVRQFDPSESGMATLTLPTGMGKTLTGLDAALALSNATDGERIVYALPFTSIVDQVADLAQTVFDADPGGDRLTIDHHLAETLVKDTQDDSDRSAGVATMLGESWRSGLIVTTFVQLFESLAGPRNGQSLKLPALSDSVVVLDEPQALPHDWWPLIRRLVGILTSEYDATVVAMTATKPRIFESEATELVPEPQRYYEECERVEYAFDSSVRQYDSEGGAVTYGEAAQRIIGTVEDSTATLAVCNTIDSAEELTEEISVRTRTTDIGELYTDELGDGSFSPDRFASRIDEDTSGLLTLHLSTRLRPVDRLRMIDTAKRLVTRDRPMIVVSTQLIEAGVDISFDQVFRDLAPMDSIVQAAGRCNRSFERERGRVVVWWLDTPAEKQLTPSQAVYEHWGDSLLSVTVNALDEVGIQHETTIDESVIAWEGVRDYYRRLADERNVGKREYVGLLDGAQAEQLGELSLIDEQRSAVDVIVCRTDTDRGLVEDTRTAWNAGNFSRANALLDETKPLRVSIPVYRSDSKEAETLQALARVHPDTELRWVDVTAHESGEYFDDIAGFTVPDTSLDRRFL